MVTLRLVLVAGLACGVAVTFGQTDRTGNKPRKVDKQEYDAIKELHKAMDDDKSGDLDRSESKGFMRDELKYEGDSERQEQFHGADDHISVDDLWILWIHSEVFNWTEEDVQMWLEHYVELPQYAALFKAHKVNGSKLPKIATNGSYLSNILGIKNPIDKQKLSLKAMDVVLFGPPNKGHNYVKDLVLMALLVLATGGCWFAYMQNRNSQKHLRKVIKDLEQLQQAEDALSKLQNKLDVAHQERKCVTEEKNTLENKFKTEIQLAKDEAMTLQKTRESTAEEIGRLKLAEQELDKLKRALEKAELQLQQRQLSVPLAELQQWLQLTYERESRYYQQRRAEAETKRLEAREMCEKIRKRRNAFLGSLRVAHTTTIDTTDQVITMAKQALDEVLMELEERSHRWKQIERICGFTITVNPGLDVLEKRLSSFMVSNQSSSNLSEFFKPLNVDGAEEDLPPSTLNSQALHPGGVPSADFPHAHTMTNLGSHLSPLTSPLGTTLPSPASAVLNSITTSSASVKPRTAWLQSGGHQLSVDSKASTASLGSKVAADAGDDQDADDEESLSDNLSINHSTATSPANSERVTFGLHDISSTDNPTRPSQKVTDASSPSTVLPAQPAAVNALKSSSKKTERPSSLSIVKDQTTVKSGNNVTTESPRQGTLSSAMTNSSSSEKFLSLEDWSNLSDRGSLKGSTEKISGKKKGVFKKLFGKSSKQKEA